MIDFRIPYSTCKHTSSDHCRKIVYEVYIIYNVSKCHKHHKYIIIILYFIYYDASSVEIFAAVCTSGLLEVFYIYYIFFRQNLARSMLLLYYCVPSSSRLCDIVIYIYYIIIMHIHYRT